jgi:hypothetical protein
MRSTYEPVHHFVGLNNLDEYDFDFKITNLNQIRIVEINADGEITQDVDGNDTTYLDSVEFDTAGGGTVYLAANLPENWHLYLVLNVVAPVQTNRFRDKGQFKLKILEEALDNIVGGLQTASYLAQRSAKLPVDVDLEDFDPTLPQDIADDDNENRVLMTNEDHTGFILGPTADQIEDASVSAAEAAASAAAALVSENNAAASAAAADGSADDAAASAAAAAASSGVLTTVIAVGTGAQTTFPTGVLLAGVNFVMVFIDTYYQDQTTYTKVGADIVFGEAPLLNSNVVILVGSVQPDVQTALTAALAAQTAAELAETNAEAARDLAIAARTGAETAEANAETAQTAAELAETNAETARDAAQGFATDAEASADDAAATLASAVIGPAGAVVDGQFALFDGITGKLVKALIKMFGYDLYNDSLYWGAILPALVFPSDIANDAGAAAIKTGDLAIDSKTHDLSVTTGHNNGATTAGAKTGHAYYGSGYVVVGSGDSGDSQLKSGHVKTGTSGDVRVGSGNAQTANGSSGDVIVGPGTIAGGSGTRGKLKLVDGSEGTVGHLWTSSGVDGSGAWAAAPAGGAFIVTGTRAAPSAIVAGTGVAYVEGTYARQLWFIEGSGGAVDVSANPQIAAAATVGRELTLIGRSDTNTVLLEDGTGLSLNGAFEMGANNVLNLVWDGSVWVEMSRR